jgi:hypothetical protein
VADLEGGGAFSNSFNVFIYGKIWKFLANRKSRINSARSSSNMFRGGMGIYRDKAMICRSFRENGAMTALMSYTILYVL